MTESFSPGDRVVDLTDGRTGMVVSRKLFATYQFKPEFARYVVQFRDEDLPREVAAGSLSWLPKLAEGEDDER